MANVQSIITHNYDLEDTNCTVFKHVLNVIKTDLTSRD